MNLMSILTIARMYSIQVMVWDMKKTYGIYPVSHHFQQVEDALVEFGLTDEIIRAAAWGHDMIEDTRGTKFEVRVRDIAERCGQSVADLVDAVSDPAGENRKARKALAYPRIREAGERATQLKLADRIANVRFSLRGEGLAGDMYKKEHKEFRHALHNEDHGQVTKNMWSCLDNLLGLESKRPPYGRERVSIEIRDPRSAG